MGEAGMYLELIRRDPFLSAMLASYDKVKQFAGDKNILDYGCGYGWGTYLLSRQCAHITGYDPAEDRIRFAHHVFSRKNIMFYKDEEALSGRRYDIICLFMVLSSVEGEESPLERIPAYLGTGGELWISYKSSDHRIPYLLKEWAVTFGFRKIDTGHRYLSAAEDVVEQRYCKYRDEGKSYAL